MEDSFKKLICLFFILTPFCHVNAVSTINNNFDHISTKEISIDKKHSENISIKNFKDRLSKTLQQPKIPSPINEIKITAPKGYVDLFQEANVEGNIKKILDIHAPYISTKYFIPENQVHRINSDGTLGWCLHTIKVWPYPDNRFYINDLKDIKDAYIKRMNQQSIEVETFVNQDNMLGFIRQNKGQIDGNINVVIKGRVLMVFIDNLCAKSDKDKVKEELINFANHLIFSNN
ncbi:MAG: hypothetical protein VW448_05380 [Gammaproteobacteria bacterium]